MRFNWLVTDLFTSLGFVLALFLLAHLLKQRRSPVSTMAWLLSIVLLPYVGVPLYLMLGGRKMGRMAGKKERVYVPPRDRPGPGRDGMIERVLQSYGVPPATGGNGVELISLGEDAFCRIINLINSAQYTIHVTTYILGRDPVGASIVDRLAARAAEGVEVRLLLDAVGSWRMNRRWLAPLTEAGGKVAYFMPLIRLPFRGRANLRNHRKTVVIDGQCALVGGMNLAEEYLGPEPDPKRWRDLVVQVCGPVVRDLDDLFRSDWRFATNEDLEPRPRAEIPAESELDGLMTAQTVASGPDVVGDPFYESLVSALFAARERVWVVTPYFIPDETLVRALDLAARRGVDVRLVVPLRSNHLIADLARGSYLHEVHDSGGSILKFRPGMVHAKAILIDDGLSIIGTANMDMRSLFLNYEVSLFFYSRPLAEQTAAWMADLMTTCRPYRVPRGGVIILMHDVFRLLSPLL